MSKQAKKSDAEKSLATISETAAPDDAGQRFAGAYQNYVAALHDIQGEWQKQWVEVYQDWVAAAQKTTEEKERKIGEASSQYALAVQDAWIEEDGQKIVTDAYRAYLRALRDACNEAQKSYEETHNTYTQPLQELGAEMNKNWERAYQNYVAAIKEAWVAAEAGAIEANSLVAIGQSISTAAYFAANTAGSGSHGEYQY